MFGNIVPKLELQLFPPLLIILLIWLSSCSVPLQVSDPQEEENRVRQLSGERGAEGGHQLLPSNDREQLGHLTTDRGLAWCGFCSLAWE